MKARKLIPFLAVVTLAVTLLPLRAAAESLSDLNEKETQTAQNGAVLSEDINNALNDVNAKYAEIEKLKQDISKAEKTIKNSEAEIKVTEQSIARRKAVVGDRMKTIQLNGEERTWQVLLDSENMSDFFNKAYAMTILQSAEKEKIIRLSKDKEKLASLQATVKNKQTELKTNEGKLQAEAQTMDAQVVTLKKQLADNQAELQQIASKKQSEEKRIATAKKAAEDQKQKAAAAAAETARKQKAAAEASKTTNSQTSESTSSSTAPASSSEKEATTPSTQEEKTPDSSNGNSDSGGTATGGNVMYMETTAYSWSETGHSITATGIDLKQQSNVIAVDPSVIPLGSLVEVAGYGLAVAGDTGGAIHGNIIDLHFPTVDQCLNWGRRYNVKVTIM